MFPAEKIRRNSDPALLLLAPFAAGILGADRIGLPALAVMACLLVSLGAAWALRKRAGACLALAAVALAAAGYLRAQTAYGTLPTDHYTRVRGEARGFLGRITTAPEVKKNRLCFEAECLRITDQRGEGRDSSGRILVQCRPRSHEDREPDSLSRGDVVYVFAPPRQAASKAGFDYRLYLRRRGILGVARPHAAREVRMLEPGRPGLTDRIRRGILRYCREALPAPHGTVLAGLLLGTRGSLPESVLGVFRDAGVVHVLAVSGLHVGLVGAICAVLLLAAGVPRRYVFLPTLALVFLYAGVVGFRHSVVRAATMATCGSLVFFLNRDVRLENALALAALVILCASPGALFEAGFQLSFLATWGIIAFAPAVTRALGNARIPRWVGGLVGASVGAQLGILPVLATHFGVVTPVSVAANLAAVPLTGLAVGSGFFGAAADALSPALGRIPSAASELFVTLLVRSSQLFARIPYGRIEVPRPPTWMSVLYLAGVAVLSRAKHIRKAPR